MPLLRNVGGTVYESGSILDEEVVTPHLKTEQISVGDADVHLNPDNPEGPDVIKYDLNAGKKGFTVEERNGNDVFTVTAAGNDHWRQLRQHRVRRLKRHWHGDVHRVLLEQQHPEGGTGAGRDRVRNHSGRIVRVPQREQQDSH